MIDPQVRQGGQGPGLEELPVPAEDGPGRARVPAVAADVDDVPDQQRIGDHVDEEADPPLAQVVGDPAEQPPGEGGHAPEVIAGGAAVRRGDHAGPARQGGDPGAGLDAVHPDQAGGGGARQHVVPQPVAQGVRGRRGVAQGIAHHLESGDRGRREGRVVVVEVVAEKQNEHHGLRPPGLDALPDAEEVGPQTVAVHALVQGLHPRPGPRQDPRHPLREVLLDPGLVGLEEGVPEKEDPAGALGRRRGPLAIVEAEAVGPHPPALPSHLPGPGDVEVGPPPEAEERVVLQGRLLQGEEPGEQDLGEGQDHRDGEDRGGAPGRDGAPRSPNPSGLLGHWDGGPARGSGPSGYAGSHHGSLQRITSKLSAKASPIWPPRVRAQLRMNSPLT